MDHMRKTSLVKAKAHLSELVDAAEHRGQRILVLRHGKPAAAIVPVELARKPKKRRSMAPAEAEALMDELAASARDTNLSVAGALGRDRLHSSL
jgi:prevent-host-death family protein